MNRRITAWIDFGELFLFKLLFVFLFLIAYQPAFSQTSYLMNLGNASLTNNNIFEFDVFIKSTGNNFSLTSYQCAFTFNVGNANNGTLTFNYIPATSELENKPSYGVGINQNDGVKKLTFASMVGNDVISSSPKKVGRFRFQNSEMFTSQTFEINWSFEGFVNTILTGGGHTEITNPLNHTNFVFNIEARPMLQNASLLNPTTLQLTFSRQLDPVTANSPANYSVNNGINVTNASLSPDGITVTLATSEHTSGNYTVVANNIKDLNGNLIDPNANSADYSLSSGDLFLNVKVFMEGPYSDGIMDASLNDLEFIPLNQPFKISPWSYMGLESVTVVPENIVDWILVELRSAVSSASIVMKRAVFITKDGSLVDLDGVSKIKTAGVQEGNYYVVLRHRNHLAIMSSSKVDVSGNPSLYDFTTNSNKAYGNAAQINFGDGRFGMFSADGNGNGSVNNADANSIWKRENGKVGYYSGDFDMNGGVNIVDKNSIWKPNNGKSSQVP